MKLPKKINICGVWYKLLRRNIGSLAGCFDTGEKVIILHSKLAEAEVGSVLLHELMECIAAVQYCIEVGKSQRELLFIHEPHKHMDTWSNYTDSIYDVIARNKLQNIIFGR